MADEHLSIGEVLSLLTEEFPDITISKIRFLESQGLIDPERTPSGYRKFFEGDIDRLRWILVQQRENFLPLKVIKDRLESAEGVPIDDGPGPPTAGPIAADTVGDTASEADGSAARAVTETERPARAVGEDPRAQPIWMADVAASRTRPSDGAAIAQAVPIRRSTDLGATGTDVSLTASELAAAAGISMEALRELEQFGLITGRAYGDDTYFDGDALLVASKSGVFLAHGIGARHLRMFKVAAEREAGFLEQVAMPLLKQRNPDARRQAVELVEELAGLGQELRGALLRSNLRQHLDRA